MWVNHTAFIICFFDCPGLCWSTSDHSFYGHAISFEFALHSGVRIEYTQIEQSTSTGRRHSQCQSISEIELGWHWMIWRVPCEGKFLKIFHFLSTTVTKSNGRIIPQWRRGRTKVGHTCSLKHLSEHPSTPSSRRLLSNDRLLNISPEENELLYYLYTSDAHHLDL